MQGRVRGKPTSNINININLKVDATKHSQMPHHGKRIPTHSHQLTPSYIEPQRPNPSTHTLHKHLQSVDEHTPPPKMTTHRDNRMTQRKQNPHQKRMKSKSLQNLKVRYYEHTPQTVQLSKSKTKSKSKSRSKSKKADRNDSPVPFRIFKETENRKNRSRDRSRSKSFSRLPTPLPKTKSMQINKEKQKGVPNDNRKLKQQKPGKKKEREKTGKKPSHTSSTNRLPNKESSRVSQQLTKKDRKPSSSQIGKPKNVPTRQKARVFKEDERVDRQPQPNRRGKSKGKIYTEAYKNRMAVQIQSAWRGYRARKEFHMMLELLGQKIESMKHSVGVKKEVYWKEDQSDNSILLVSKEQSARSRSSKSSHLSSQQHDTNKMFMAELQKLRNKLDEQEDRFKKLANQNSELKANLSRIHSEPMVENSRDKRSVSSDLEINQQVVALRIESEESEDERNNQTREKDEPKRPCFEVPLVIDIEDQSEPKEIDYAGLKKKVQFYQCSPRNGNNFNLSFNRSLIQQLFNSKEEGILRRYQQKNNDYKASLLSELLSPRSFKTKCTQFEKKIEVECKQAVSRYREAEKALMMVAELENDQSNIENQDRGNIIKGLFDSKKETGVKVDEVEGNMRYHPIMRHQSIKEEEPDISALYHKAMEDGKSPSSKKRQVYIKKHEQKSPEPEQPVQFRRSPQRSIENVLPRGFQTNLDYVRVFLVRFCEYFRDQAQLKERFLTNFLEETTYDKTEFLKLFRPQAVEPDGQWLFPYHRQILSEQQVIEAHMLNEFYNAITNDPSSPIFDQPFATLFEVRQQQQNKYGYAICDFRQVHDMVIVEALNDALNYEKPGGYDASNINHLISNYDGVWDNKVRIKFSQQLKDSEINDNLETVLGVSISMIINDWASCLCGFINDDESQQIEEEQITMVRQRRLSMMLEKSLLDDEKSMTDMRMFRLHVKMTISDVICNSLLNQMLRDLQKIHT